MRPKPDVAQAWHSAQLAAMAQQWQAGAPQFQPPKEPARPWGVGGKVQQQYGALYTAARVEDQHWQALRAKALAAADFSRELLLALHSRDAAQIEPLSSQLKARREELASLIAQWSDSHGVSEAAAAELETLWNQRCPAGDFAVELSRVDVGSVGKVAKDALNAWHTQVYRRLAQSYLGMEAEDPLPAPGNLGSTARDKTVPAALPESSAPATELAAAVDDLEHALAARHLFESVAERDAELAKLFEPDTDSQASFDTVAARRYREQRLPIARARLALLSHIDALLSASENVLQTEVTRQWQRTWPDCPLEINVYAFAGLPKRVPTSNPASRPR